MVNNSDPEQTAVFVTEPRLKQYTYFVWWTLNKSKTSETSLLYVIFSSATVKPNSRPYWECAVEFKQTLLLLAFAFCLLQVWGKGFPLFVLLLLLTGSLIS